MKDGGQAFPIEWKRERPLYLRESGMTLRDYFAGQALLNKMMFQDYAEENIMLELTAECCYQIADAMIAERDK